MNKGLLNFTKKQRRLIIVLMSINFFALFVNFAELDFNFENNKKTSYGSNLETSRYFFLTDHNDYKYKSEHFWPFVKFADFSSHNTRGGTLASFRDRFNGIFYEFDHTEFIVFSILIFGIPIIRKIW